VPISIPRGVYAITDEALLPTDIFLDRVEAALKAGISVLQYRNKNGDAALRQEQCRHLRSLCNHYHTLLLINDDVELCLEVGADGVHLGQSDLQVKDARAALGDNAVIGVTCHSSMALAWQAQQEGASYVAFGRFYPSLTKPHAAPADIQILAEARRQLTVPLVAIGGINAENGAALIKAGADLLAVIHYLFAFPDISLRVSRLNNLFQNT